MRSSPKRICGFIAPTDGDDLAAHEIGQMGGDGGRADIDRDAEGALGEARHDGDDVAALAQGDGDLPLPRAQRLLQASERREIGVRFVETPLLAQSLLQATKIARRLVHVRLARPRRNRGGRPGRSRSDVSPPACGRPADEPDFRAARRRRDRRKSWPGIQAAGRRRTVRASRRSGPRPLPTASHDRRWTEEHAWRNRPRRFRPDSGRKCLARRRPN